MIYKLYTESEVNLWYLQKIKENVIYVEKSLLNQAWLSIY